MKYKEISKYPEVKKDIAILIDKSVTSAEIESSIKKAGGSLLSSSTVFDIYTGDGIQEGKKSLAYSLSFTSHDRTLTDEEINKTVEKIIERLEKDFKAELR